MRHPVIIALLTALALVAGACGGQDTAAETPASDGVTLDTSSAAPVQGGSEAAPAAGEGSEASAAAPEAGAGAGGTLDFMWGTSASSVYDPHTASNPFVYPFLLPAYDRLFDLDDDGNVVPMLATDFSFSDDGLTLTLTLRDDVTFHDGAPFDAEAVKANIERAQSLENSTVKPDLAPVTSVEVVDPQTVELTLGAPAASLPALLADRAGMMISPTALENDDLDLFPVGAGPYEVVEHEPGTIISYEPADDYWDPDVQGLERLNISMSLDPQTRLNALRSGQIDATTLNADQISEAESAGIDVATQPTSAVYLMYLNKSSEELANPQVRQALSYAIDREAIADALFLGECTPTVQVLPETDWGHDPSITADTYAYDPDKARQLLAEAGYPDGFSMSTVVITVPFYVAGAEALQAQFAEIGVTLDVRALEAAQLLSTFTSEQASDAYYSQWPGATDPAKTVASLLQEQSFLNPGGLSVPAIEEEAAAGLAVTEREERAPHYQAVMQAAVESAFHLPVCSPSAIFAQSDTVSGLDPDRSGNVDFRGTTVSG